MEFLPTRDCEAGYALLKKFTSVPVYIPEYVSKFSR